ncbi:Dbl homology domain-containing protein, partial [Mycena albidolilacea]
MDRCGALEVHRQEAIYTLCVTEEAFVSRLTNTINLFILPLRMQDSKCYISGVPPEIAKLFDWVEDILNLHTHLLSALRRVRETQHPVVERAAEAIRTSFVKRLEVYQPYLAKLVNVAGTIARLVADTTNDFGEFVRIQESAQECDGWSLESLLVDPVTRLGKYPVMFRKLREYTPKTHSDYAPTLALVYSTEMVIKVMTEVKIREDEYDLVKSMSRRIKGLPPSVSLAKRGRRLLCHGQFLWVGTDPGGSARTRTPPKEAPSFDDHRSSRHRDNTALQKRTSNLVDAVHEWDQRRARSGSSASASTAASYSTQSSVASSEAPRTPS